jgi:hypothetical protein
MLLPDPLTPWKGAQSMIPDIALMIVVYGAARLLVAALEPHRHTAGTAGTVATGLTWMIAAFAIAGLGILGLMVVDAGASVSNLTGG